MTSAPFTDEQVASLNGYQLSGVAHEFTCPTGDCPVRSLTARNDGWVCDGCGYSQDWAHDWMADWSWRKMSPWGSNGPA